jgi:prohibitin 2
MEPVLQLIVDALLLVALVGAIAVWVLHYHEGVKKAAILASFLLIVALIGSLSTIIVPAGNVGVVTAFGEVQEGTLAPGLHFRAPFINAVHLVTTRVQPHAFSEIDAASAEYQTVKLTGVMNYHIDGTFASDLYQRVGDDFAAKVLDPAFNDYIKTVVPSYGISEILGKRDEIRQRAKADLQANLSQYHIIVDDIYIANIAFSPEYEAAIEAKQVAQQQVQTEQQVLAQRTIQAQQQVATAKGNAEATIENAKGQATANKLLSDSLTPALVQYTLIQKLGPSIQTILLPTGQPFILDPNALVPAK